jgi:hypothetical protein
VAETMIDTSAAAGQTVVAFVSELAPVGVSVTIFTALAVMFVTAYCRYAASRRASRPG